MSAIQIQYGHYRKEYLKDSKNYRNGSTLEEMRELTSPCRVAATILQAQDNCPI
jgi:hypothetical protein